MLSKIFSWFLSGRVISNLCQKLPLQCLTGYAILIAHAKNHVASNTILIAQEMSLNW